MAQMGNPLQGMGPLEQVGRQIQQKAQVEMQQQINSQVQKANQQLNKAADHLRQAAIGKQTSQTQPGEPAPQMQQTPEAAQPQPAPQAEQKSGRVMSEESKAAQQRLRDILAGRKGLAAGNAESETSAPKISITPGRKASLNDQIPTKYKRLQKSKKSGDSPSKK